MRAIAMYAPLIMMGLNLMALQALILGLIDIKQTLVLVAAWSVALICAQAWYRFSKLWGIG